MRRPALTFHAATLAVYPLLLVVLALLSEHPLLVAVLLAVTLAALALSGGLGRWGRSLRYLVPLLAVILLLNLLINKNGGTVLFTGGPRLWLIGQLRITLEAVMFGLVMALRMLVVIAAFALYLSWLPGDRAFGLVSRWAGRSAVTAMLAARLIPYLSEQSEQVRDVMRTRGVRFAQGGLWQRMRAHRPLLGVLLISALEGSWSVAESMEARGYGQGRRTNYHRERWSGRDALAWLAMGFCLTAAVLFVWQGVFDYAFYPRLQPLTAGGSALWAAVLGVGGLMLLPPLLAGRRRER